MNLIYFSQGIYEELRKEIEDEREREIKKLQEGIEPDYINTFMNQYFKDKKRLKLGDIVKMWKLVKKEMIKQDEIAEMLEESGWKITNSHNIRYASKG